jgi:hypothetical protein
MTAKEALTGVRMYGRPVSQFLLPDQMEFIEKAMQEYAEQQAAPYQAFKESIMQELMQLSGNITPQNAIRTMNNIIRVAIKY